MAKEKLNISLIIKILILLSFIQTVRICIIKFVFLFIEETIFNNTLINLIIMVVLTMLILLYSRKQKINIDITNNINTKRKKIVYYMITTIWLILIITTPVITQNYNICSIITLIYSVIITPIFEELLFRGFLWSRLMNNYKNEFVIYLIITILFGIWHLGYIDSIVLNMKINNMNDNIIFVMFMKIMTGLIYGIVIGFIRYKTKNTYSGILTHSVMNIFGR